MVVEAMEEYALAYAEASYEDPGEHAPMGFMSSGGLFDCENDSYWWDQKHPSFPRQNCSEITNWETVAMHISVAK